MIFWRKKKNAPEQERDERDDEILHPNGEPEMEPPVEYEAEIDEATKHELEETEADIIDNLDDEPVPTHSKVDDAIENEELSDHSNEGGWFSRLTKGLSKSTNKITQGITDLITKRKLDQDTLDELEDVLIMADLGPATAAKVVADFSEGRFGKDLEEDEIKQALAESMAKILEPVAAPMLTDKPESGGPFTILVCGVNGVGKTTTIGKIAHNLTLSEKKKVMIAAGDTFRAAAIEQLDIWAGRTQSKLIKKEIGADAASVAYEAYEQAEAEGADVLMIDTAGRLQNKKNLMEELQKIVRVLKKKDENLPHAVLLVLDATTGQNAFSQVEAFKEMVSVTGLIVTKLDGSAKGGVLVGLADQFGLPVHAIGVGEGAQDMQAFDADHYARSLVGLEN